MERPLEADSGDWTPTIEERRDAAEEALTRKRKNDAGGPEPFDDQSPFIDTTIQAKARPTHRLPPRRPL